MALPIQFRRGTAQTASANNEILDPGEPGFVLDETILKIGDGETPFNDLPAFAPANNAPRTVANQAARLALNAKVGDIVKQLDNGQTYVLIAKPASDDDNWLIIGAGAGGGGAGVIDGIRVADYGAIGDGVTDDTAALNAGIAAAYAQGKPLYLDAKTYLVNGNFNAVTNGILTIPQLAQNSAPRNLTIIGVSIPPTSDNPLATVGTRIVTTKTGLDGGGNPIANFPALLSGSAYEATTAANKFNYVRLEIENVQFVVPGNSAITGINAHNLIGCALRKVDVITPQVGAAILEPTYTNQYGIMFPGVNNYAMANHADSIIIGVYNGILTGEHYRAIGRVALVKCKRAVVVPEGYRPNSGEFIIEQCPNIITSIGGSMVQKAWVDYKLWLERNTLAAAEWYGYKAGKEIDDPQNLLRGRIDYKITQTGEPLAAPPEISTTGLKYISPRNLDTNLLPAGLNDAVLSDDFVGANGTSVAGRKPTKSTYQISIGAGFAVSEGTATIQGNAVQTAGGGASTTVTIDTGLSSGKVEMLVANRTGATLSAILRYVDDNNFLGVATDAGSTFIYKVVGGVLTTIATAGLPVANGQTLTVYFDQDTVRVKTDLTNLLHESGCGVFRTATKQGFRSYNSVTLENFTVAR